MVFYSKFLLLYKAEGRQISGIVKPGILFDFNARADSKTETRLSIAEFYYCKT